MGKTLILEKRGCDFHKNDNIGKYSDVGNHRVGVYDHSIRGKDGRMYIIEFVCSQHFTWRKTHKITGKPLKHEVREVILPYGLFVNTEYEERKNGEDWISSWRNSVLEAEIHAMHIPFTLDGILQAVNYISADHYDSIKFE